MRYTYEKYRRKTTFLDWMIAVGIISCILALCSINEFVNPLNYFIFELVVVTVGGFLSVYIIMYLRYNRRYNFWTHQRFRNERSVLQIAMIVFFVAYIITILLGPSSYDIGYKIYLMGNPGVTQWLTFGNGLTLPFFMTITAPSTIFAMYCVVYVLAWALGYRSKYYVKRIRK